MNQLRLSRNDHLFSTALPVATPEPIDNARIVEKLFVEQQFATWSPILRLCPQIGPSTGFFKIKQKLKLYCQNELFVYLFQSEIQVTLDIWQIWFSSFCANLGVHITTTLIRTKILKTTCWAQSVIKRISFCSMETCHTLLRDQYFLHAW